MRDAGNDSAKKILGGEAQDDGGDPGAGEQTAELGLSVISDAQDEEQRDQVNKERDDLAEKMGNGRAPFFPPITLPEVAIEECDDENGAEEKDGDADMVAPVCLHSVESGGGVKRERQAEKLEENAEAHARPALKEAADRESGEKRPDENDHRDGGFLGLEKMQHRHRQNISV